MLNYSDIDKKDSREWMTCKDPYVGIKFDAPLNCKYSSPMGFFPWNESQNQLLIKTHFINKFLEEEINLVEIKMERMTDVKFNKENEKILNSLSTNWSDDDRKPFIWGRKLHLQLDCIYVNYGGGRSYYLFRRDIKINANEIIYTEAYVFGPEKGRDNDCTIVRKILNSIEELNN
jgi:hypothetical protein